MHTLTHNITRGVEDIRSNIHCVLCLGNTTNKCNLLQNLRPSGLYTNPGQPRDMKLKVLLLLCFWQVVLSAPSFVGGASLTKMSLLQNIFPEIFTLTPIRVSDLDDKVSDVTYEGNCALTHERISSPREFFFWFAAVQARLCLIKAWMKTDENAYVSMKLFLYNLVQGAKYTLETTPHSPETQLMRSMLNVIHNASYSDLEQDDWLQCFANMAGIPYPFRKEDFEGTEVGSRESLAYRMLTYTVLIAGLDPTNVQQENSKAQLLKVFLQGFHVEDLSVHEIILFRQLASNDAASGEALFSVLRLRPTTALAGKIFKFLRKLDVEYVVEKYPEWAQVFRPSNQVLLMIFERYNGFSPTECFLTNENMFLNKEKWYLRNMPGESSDNLTEGLTPYECIDEHFLNPDQLKCSVLPYPNTITHNPLSMCTDSIALNHIREMPHHRQFMITPLDDVLILPRITHFQAHLCMENYGEEAWQASFPEHERLDNDIRAFISEMFSVLGWLIRHRFNEAIIVYRGRDSIGSGLYLDALQLMASVIFLPVAQLFRYDMNLGGFIPLPTLSSTYFALIAALHTRLLSHGIAFDWQLAPVYGKFLNYDGLHKVLIDDLVKTIYQKELHQFCKIVEMGADVNEFYSSLLQTHRPFPLDYPSKTLQPANPCPFLNPMADFAQQESKGLRTDGSFSSETRPAATKEDVDAYLQSFIEFFKEHLLLGRFEYQRHFLLRIDTNRWHWSTYHFWDKLLTDMTRPQSTFNAIWSAIQFKFPPDYKEVQVQNDEPCTEYPDPEMESRKVLERILYSYSPEKQMKFFSFCTALRRIPLQGMEPYPITVETHRPQINTNRLQSSQVIPWPSARTCFRTLNWVVSPTYSACRVAFDKVLEHDTGFGIKEM
jgi:hypothetical protein